MKLDRLAAVAVVALAGALTACGGSCPQGAAVPTVEVSTTTLSSADETAPQPRVGKSQRATARLEDLREPKRLPSREAHKSGFGDYEK
jgi:hypothetical protein